MKPEDDYRRIKTVREEIGPGNCQTRGNKDKWLFSSLDGILMIDANQRWDVQEAIDRVKALAEFRPLWVSKNAYQVILVLRISGFGNSEIWAWEDLNSRSIFWIPVISEFQR